MQKRVAVFGSTGSIGTQALEVIKSNPELFSVEILTAQTNDELLIQQAREFNPNMVVIGDENHTILPEILKHNRLHCIHFVTKNKMAAEQTYAKVEHHYTDACDWFKKEIKPVDIIIHLNKAESTDFHHFYKNPHSYNFPQDFLKIQF